jgi:hypothetical protein
MTPAVMMLIDIRFGQSCSKYQQKARFHHHCLCRHACALRLLYFEMSPMVMEILMMAEILMMMETQTSQRQF